MRGISTKEPWHAENISKVLKHLDTSAYGLQATEANKRLQEFGYNQSPEKGFSPLKTFLNQFKRLTIVLLILSAVIYFMISPRNPGGWLLLVVLLFHLAVGFLTEFKREKALQKLDKKNKSKVLRGGVSKDIDTRFIVPGDIINLKAGDKVPADARIISQSNLEADETISTGEIKTKTSSVLNKNTQKNMLFSGTFIIKGNAKAVVVNTNTEPAKIQKKNEAKPKTAERMLHLGEITGVFILLACAIVFFLALVNYNGSVPDALMLALSLAVATYPGILSIVATTLLVFSATHLIKTNILVRNLQSFETLKDTDVICTDKDILTHNEMTVREIYANEQLIEVSGHGYEPQGEFTPKKSIKNLGNLLTAAILCNNSTLTWTNKHTDILGDPTEGALLVMGAKGGKYKENLEHSMPRIKEHPFDTERKLMSTVNKIKDKEYVFAKGAPDILLDKCSKIEINGKTKKLTANERDKLLQKNSEMGKKTLRVLGVAYKIRDSNRDEEGLVFLGLTGMLNPVRNEVISSVKKCLKAGINVKIITGDHRETAAAVAKELGLKGYALSGEEIDRIPDLRDTSEQVDVYARVKPQQKLKILEGLKKSGHVVAITGGNVNDAPAVKSADIGISKKTSPDIVKESSDISLLKDKFSSILSAVKQSKGAYTNINGFAKYLLSSNLGVLFTMLIWSILGFTLTGKPLPLFFISLFANGILSVGFDTLEPESINEKLSYFDIIFTGLIIAAGTIFISLYSGQSLYYSWSMALAVLIVFQIFNVFNYKLEKTSLRHTFYNKWFLLSIAASILIMLSAFYTPLSTTLQLVHLSVSDWLIIIAVASLVVVLGHIKKLLLNLFSGMHSTRI